MAEIAVTNCAKLEDYKQAVIHAGGEVRVVEHGMDVAEALRGAGGLLLTGGDDVAPSHYGETRITADIEGRARARRVRDRARAGSAAHRLADLRDLPRCPGDERGLWRNARPGHPDAG